MQDEFGPNFVTVTDDEGNDIELEYVDALEHKGITYMLFSPPWRKAPTRRARITAW